MIRFLLLIFFSFTSIFADIILPENIEKLDDFTIESYYDDSKQQTIQTVTEKTFVKTPNQFTFGHKRGFIWFKLTLNNQGINDKFILYFTEPYFQELTLYKKVDNNWTEDKNGANVKLQNRSLYHHTPIFELEIPKNSTKTIYIKAHSKLTTAGEFELYSSSYFNSMKGHYSQLFYMFYLGTIFFVTLLNLFLFVRLKESIYLYYSGYTFFYILWISAYSGLILYTFVDGYFHEFMMVISLFVMFLILFSSKFLNIKVYLPKADYFLTVFALLFGILALLILIDFEIWFEIMNAFASLAFIVLFSVAIYIYKKQKDVNVKYYIFAMSIYMITVSLMSAMANGWIENNDINRYSFLFGAFFEIMLFSIVLTNRFYIFQNEKLEIQKELLDIKTKNETILESQISERTKDISELLKDKELLLKELYHRVKNNFHNVIGLLWIEADGSHNEQSKDSFLKLISRIKSMSLVNQYLYENDTLSKIDTTEYMTKIINEIKQVYTNKNISINLKSESFNIDLDSAMTLAVIINELLNNSIKHHNLKGDCIINIYLENEKKEVKLIIHDNGLGFDENGEYNGLGLNLIADFSNKLSQSYYEFEKENGTKFTLNFKLDMQ